MTVLSTKELYGLFLDSEWWRRLTWEKKRSVGNRCELCGGVNELQSHHVFYRPNWFDTQLKDLLVLCCKCHEKQHQASSPHIQPPQTRKTPHRRRKANRKLPGWLRKQKRRHQLGRQPFQPYRARHSFRCKPAHHWIQRGNSSN